MVGALVVVFLWQDESTPPTAEQRRLLCSATISRVAPKHPDEVGRWTHRPSSHYHRSLLSRAKEWRFVSVLSAGEFSLAAAVAFFPYITESFAYVWDVRSNTSANVHARKPPFWDVSNVARVERVGEDRIRLVGRVGDTVFNVTLLLEESLHIGFPLSANRVSNVHKVAGALLSADSTVGKYSNSAGTWLGGADWTMGNLNREMQWKWLQLNGWAISENGTTVRVGVNLSRDVYMCAQNIAGAEDAIWIDGNVFPPTEEVSFSIPSSPLVEKWRVSSSSIDIEAVPTGAHHADDSNYGLIAQSFVQVVTTVTGRISVAGQTYKLLPGAMAVVERHSAKW